MTGLYRDLVELLARNGWVRVRSGKGSHEIWADAAGKRHVTVPKSTKSRHTANEVLKQAGLPKSL